MVMTPGSDLMFDFTEHSVTVPPSSAVSLASATGLATVRCLRRRLANFSGYAANTSSITFSWKAPSFL